MMTEVALSSGETLGAVSIPKDTSELRGGNFMHIRVVVDITKSLCRGDASLGTRIQRGGFCLSMSAFPTYVIGAASFVKMIRIA